MNPILIIGANGQIGTELSDILLNKYERHEVILADISIPKNSRGIFENIDILDRENIERIILKYDIKTVINLAAVLSAKGELDPTLTWRVNVDGLINILELAKKYKLKIFQPSSIAVFGPDTPKQNVDQNIFLHPTTMYGVTKVTGESLCHYYAHQYGIDVRSVRFPGVIGGNSMPGGGTTDYAVEIFHESVQHGAYTCYLRHDTSLPMIYMDDAIEAIVQIMSAPSEKIKIRTSYNINSLSFTPEELSNKIKTQISNFNITYDPDRRQSIADSWPASLNDEMARNDWSWQPKTNLHEMTLKMIDILENKYKK